MNRIDNYILNLFIQSENFKHIMTFSKNKYEKQLNKLLLKNTLESIENIIKSYRQKVFTLKELSYFDGSNDKPAYVAIDNIVYDVSMVSQWGGGSHFGLLAGQNLSKEFNSCHPNNQDILLKLPIVGTLLNEVNV